MAMSYIRLDCKYPLFANIGDKTSRFDAGGTEHWIRAAGALCHKDLFFY